MDPKIIQLQEEIERLKLDKADREAALPAHSIRPHQLLVIEELEEEIERKQKEMEELLCKGEG
jgi:sensor histidine kinase YesM